MESIWSKTCAIPPRRALHGDVETEIAVVGAGMAGVLIAAALQKEGKQVLVLEANRIGSGQTRNTTAKITAQHGLFARKLIEALGEDRAKQYATANLAAIDAYRELIRSEGIDCDFEEAAAYVYGNDLKRLKQEAEAEAQLGLPASLIRDPDVPGGGAGAVRVDRQAQFHPLKFLKAVARPLTIYENTPVRRAKNHVLFTDGGRVRAERIVFACHYPFVNFPGLYFARMHQECSYVLALENAAYPDGMWIGAGDGGYSFRKYGSLLLLGGGGHRTGENHKGGRYEELRARAAEWFPNSREVAHWSAQDCITADGAPYIGQYAKSRPYWYVATGFQKWGMTGSMVSAMLLRDAICGGNNPYAEAFAANRFDAETVRGVAGESAHAVKSLTKQLFQIPAKQAAELPRGHGGIVFLHGKKVGAYKDADGTVYAVDIRCPHLGCQLEWNPDEKSWDCPCHGSRFDFCGELISGPAQSDIKG